MNIDEPLFPLEPLPTGGGRGKEAERSSKASFDPRRSYDRRPGRGKRERGPVHMIVHEAGDSRDLCCAWGSAWADAWDGRGKRHGSGHGMLHERYGCPRSFSIKKTHAFKIGMS